MRGGAWWWGGRGGSDGLAREGGWRAWTQADGLWRQVGGWQQRQGKQGTASASAEIACLNECYHKGPLQVGVAAGDRARAQTVDHEAQSPAAGLKEWISRAPVLRSCRFENLVPAEFCRSTSEKN